MPNSYTIILTKGNTTTHELTLNDDGHTRAIAGDTIRWEIGDNTIRSIKEIFDKPGSDNVFRNDPVVSNDGQNAQATIDSRLSKPCSAFIYSIVWIAPDETEHTFDPIISIKPSVSISPWPILGPIIGSIVGFLASFAYWRKLKEDLKREKEKLEEQNKQLQLQNNDLQKENTVLKSNK